MSSTCSRQGTRESSTESVNDMEQPPQYQEYQPPEDFYAPRVRDFQPPTPEIAARNADSDAESVLPSYDAVLEQQTQWGRYKSEEEYLAALRAFVEDKDYADGGVDGHGNSVGLIGFYGTKTGADYASQPGPWDDSKRKKRKKPDCSDRHDAYCGFIESASNGKVKVSFWQRIRKDRADTR